MTDDACTHVVVRRMRVTALDTGAAFVCDGMTGIPAAFGDPHDRGVTTLVLTLQIVDMAPFVPAVPDEPPPAVVHGVEAVLYHRPPALARWLAELGPRAVRCEVWSPAPIWARESGSVVMGTLHQVEFDPVEELAPTVSGSAVAVEGRFYTFTITSEPVPPVTLTLDA